MLQHHGCGRPSHFNRRTLLKAAACSGSSWLTPVAELLCRAAEKAPRGKPARSVIVLWMGGGPSQLETFDPKPGSNIAGGTKAIATTVPGVQLAAGYERLAEQLQHVALVRSVVSKEGDHERATYNVKTGFRPDPTLVHPAIGAVVCHQLSDKVEIPRHVSILPNQWPARGGYLGDEYDAFQIFDPQGAIPDVTASVSDRRFRRRVDDLFNVVESEFSRGRMRSLDQQKTLHGIATRAALEMMSSEQLQAFDVNQAPQSVRDEFGDTPFGRGCLAAARLTQAGVRCVEVTLPGWDSHVNNHGTHTELAAVLDPAMAALIGYLDERKLLDETLVLWGGEFGRTPRINPAAGRDHWPHGFTVALAGGGIQGGRVIGETSPDPPPVEEKQIEKHVCDPRHVSDIHATVFAALGIDFQQELLTPIGRPMVVSEGKVIRELLPA